MSNKSRYAALQPTHPWENRKLIWVRIQVDYVGPFLAKMFILISDSFTKWIELFLVQTPTSKVTIKYFIKCFATYGLPLLCITDNASSFTSEAFAVFMRCNNIHHIKSALYHLATNDSA